MTTTVRLLATYDGNPPQTIVRLPDALAASFVAAGNASLNLTGGINVPPPAITHVVGGGARLIYSAAGALLGIGDSNGNLILNSSGATTPVGATVPGAPTGLALTAAAGAVIGAFTAPASTGGDPIQWYELTLSNGTVVRGDASPIAAAAPAGSAVTAVVRAVNGVGPSVASNTSNSVTPTGAAVATALTLTGPTAVAQNVATTNYTVALSPNGGTVATPVTVTPTPVAGVTFAPTSLTLTTASPSGTFTATATTTGTKSIVVTNDGGLTNPGAISLVVSAASVPATALTLTGPTAVVQGVASTNYTVALAPNGGTVASPVTVTPTAVAGVTFAPTSLTLSTGSPSGTFTATSSTTGTKSIAVTNNGGLTNPAAINLVVSAATPQTVTIPSSAFIGAGGTGTDGNGAYRSLPSGATTDLTFDPGTSLIMDQAYEVFMNWSAPSATGNFTGRFEYMPDTTVDNGTTKYCTIGKMSTTGALDRSQLPITLCRTSASPLPKLRFGRNNGDTAIGAMQIYSIDFVPVATPSDATVNVISAKINNAVTLTPNNGNAVTRGVGLNTPICTSDDALYVQCPSTVGGQTTRLAKMNKTTGAEILTVTVNTVTGGHDGVIGHRDSSCFVTPAGTVITHPEGHMQPWQGKYALNGDIANMVAIATPTGLDAQCAYRRFYQNPYDGSVWMAVRGYQYASGIYKWNETNKTFTRTSATFIAGDFNSFVGSYGMEIAFASATKIYITEEWFRGSTAQPALSGYPRQNTSILMSNDSGVSWKRMANDKFIPIPASIGNDDGAIAFPNLNNNQNSVGGNVVVAGDGNALVVSPWTHPADTLRSLWIAKWNPTTKLWDRRRLLANDGANHIGNPKSAYTQDGKIYVVCASSDDHSLTGGDRVPENNQIYVFVCSEPTGLIWNRYAINHAAAGYSGAYIDSEGIRKDNILRLLPIVRTDDLRDEVWTLALPA